MGYRGKKCTTTTKIDLCRTTTVKSSMITFQIRRHFFNLLRGYGLQLSMSTWSIRFFHESLSLKKREKKQTIRIKVANSLSRWVIGSCVIFLLPLIQKRLEEESKLTEWAARHDLTSSKRERWNRTRARHNNKLSHRLSESCVYGQSWDYAPKSSGLTIQFKGVLSCRSYRRELSWLWGTFVGNARLSSPISLDLTLPKDSLSKVWNRKYHDS